MPKTQTDRIGFSEQRTIRFTKQDMEDLIRIARERRTHVGTLIREAVAEFLRRNPQKRRK